MPRHRRISRNCGIDLMGRKALANRRPPQVATRPHRGLLLQVRTLGPASHPRRIEARAQGAHHGPASTTSIAVQSSTHGPTSSPRLPDMIRAKETNCIDDRHKKSQQKDPSVMPGLDMVLTYRTPQSPVGVIFRTERSVQSRSSEMRTWPASKSKSHVLR